MTKITQLPVVTTLTDAASFIIFDENETRRLSWETFTSVIAKGDQGYTGSVSTGFDGSRGFTGSTGYIGSRGFTGSIGFTGSSGLGYSGSVGITGSQGSTGFDGSKGYTGSRGQPGYSGSAGTAPTRAVISTSTGILSNGSTSTTHINGYKSYLLQNVVTNVPSWVVIYSDESSRTADLTRPSVTPPLAGSGVIAEVITTSGSLTKLITPGILGFNNDNPVGTNTYLKVTNNSGGSTTITVTLTLLKLED